VTGVQVGLEKKEVVEGEDLAEFGHKMIEMLPHVNFRVCLISMHGRIKIFFSLFRRAQTI
jgi:hypothetical protein